MPAAIEISSPAFQTGKTIPAKFTCDGEDRSPALQWGALPTGTQSLALIVDDPDAPGGTWVHWVLFNLPASLKGLPEGVTKAGVEGVNDFGTQKYGGPCPPKGKPHRYFFKLYALDQTLALQAGASKAQLEKAMQGHILGQGQMIGTYKH